MYCTGIVAGVVSPYAEVGYTLRDNVRNVRREVLAY